MPAEALRTLIGRLRHVAGAPSAADVSDAHLLERFVQTRDRTAFELLVWRHGAMVLNVCRRVLRREHDAEDAFQAAFLTLVRKAGAIGNGASVGGWLYQVAYRIALRARAAARVAPLPAKPLPDPSAEEPIAGLFRAELAAALDQEVHRLPDKYRVAFVLCYLEGRTTEAVARCLGCPPGTVGTRLARARALLRRRLARRGFDPSAPALLHGLAPALPGALVDATIRAALHGTADLAAAAGLISAQAAALAKGALRTMTLTKWMLTSVFVLTLGVICGGAMLTACPPPAAAPPATKPPADAKDAGVVLKWKFEKDKPFYQELTTETKLAIKVQDNDLSQTQKQTIYLRWTPTAQIDSGWTIAEKIIGVKMDVELGGNKISYDSTKADNAKNALSDFFGGIVGAEFKVRLDEESKVQNVEGREEFIKKFSASNPALDAALANVITNGSMGAMAETSFAGLPGREVQVGDTWTRTSTLDLGAAGSYETANTFIYRGREGDLDRISVESTLKYQAPPADVSGLPVKIKKADLKSTQCNGVFFFDRDKGRMVRTEMRLKLNGKVTISIGGQDSDVDLDQTQTTTLRTTDANPLNDGKP
ncbi:MAG TPA: DUF6263 family protein [Gemmataceae bacterium]|nr:DUF6263 family protein [Gemmataceae bacterium]